MLDGLLCFQLIRECLKKERVSPRHIEDPENSCYSILWTVGDLIPIDQHKPSSTTSLLSFRGRGDGGGDEG